MADLVLKHIWNGPGYRDLRIDCVDAETGRPHSLRIGAKDMQRLINACADAAQQIGVDPPIDWSLHPTQIYWPQVTPWRAGPPAPKARVTAKCPDCGGSGEKFVLPRGNPFSMKIETLSRAMVKVPCRQCHGSGTAAKQAEPTS